MDYFKERGEPRLTGAPRLHQPIPVKGGGPDAPPGHPAWCVAALPGVFAFRILAMLDLREPDEAEAYLNPAARRPFERTYVEARGQDGKNFQFVERDLAGLWAGWAEGFHNDLVESGLYDDAAVLHALDVEARASCMLAVAIGTARKCRALVALVRELLEAHGVPTLGGYATRFPYLTRLAEDSAQTRCTAPSQSAVPGVRSRLSVAMLGLEVAGTDGPVSYFGSGGEKRFASDLLLQWTDWRHQRVTDLHVAGRRDEAAALNDLNPREWAACMLAAQVQIAQDCSLYSQARRDEVAEWVPRADARLSGLLAQWATKENKGESVPVALVQPRGMRLTPVDPRWAFASQALAADGGLSECVHLMQFMFVFHANLGLWQVPLDNGDRHPNRNQFYETLAQVLRYGCTAPELRETAGRVLRALPEMPLLTGVALEGNRASLLDDIALQLPPCFNLYVGYVAPSVEDTVSQATNDKARARIRQTHQLADRVAEMFLDIVRLRVDPASRKDGDRPGVPGFHWGNVAYAAERARYRQQAAGQEAVDAQIAQRWRPGDDPSDEADEILHDCDAYRRRMAAHFAYLLTPHGAPPRLIKFLQLNVPRNCSPAWPGDDADPRPCAMCQIRPH